MDPTGSSRHWRRRPVAANILWVAAVGVPILAAVLASLMVAALLPPPASAVGALLWWLAVLATPPVVLVVVGRAARRLLPLATLLKLSLAFPDRAPSRYAVAREARTVAQLRRRAAGDSTLEFDQTPATAASILALVTDLQHHDRATRGHSERVRVYVELIAEELGISPSRRERLAWAALLHDVGKLAVPASLLNKPGPPNDDEWTRLQRHPQEGMRLVSPLGEWLGSWVDGIGDHHERYDGTGYPCGLAAEDISLSGRIVAVADAFETMTAARPYKRPVGIRQARSELVRAAASHFDPKVVRAFLNVSVGRLRWTLGPVAWLGTLPFLPRFRRLSDSAMQAVLTATTVVGLAAGGAITPALGPSIEERSVPPPATLGTPRAGGGGGTPEAQPRAEPGTPPPPPMALPGTVDELADGATAQPPAPSAMGRIAPPSTGPQSPAVPPPGVGPPCEAASPPAPRPPPRLSDPLTLTLYLDAWEEADTTSQPTLPLRPDAPVRGRLANYDVDRDCAPGLLLGTTTRGRSETDPARRATWVTTFDRLGVLGGLPSVTFWSALADFAPGLPAQVDVYLDACALNLTRCHPLGHGRAADPDWSRGQDGWVQRTVDIGLTGALADEDRTLVLTFTADAAATASDLWLAFGTRDFPSDLRVPTLLPPTPSRAGSPSQLATRAGVRRGTRRKASGGRETPSVAALRSLLATAMLVAACSTPADPASAPLAPSAAVTVPTVPAPEPGEVLVGAGDIASCDGDGDEATAELLARIPGTVATFGDNVYPAGTLEQFRACYDPTWGRYLGRTRPAAGNHDYDTLGGDGYFRYFGSRAGDPAAAGTATTWGRSGMLSF